MARWSTMWAKGAVSRRVAALWTSAIVSPIDCGEKVDAPGQRKIRPIACSEALLKMADSAVLDGLQKEIETALEPHQLGCGAADGAGMIVSAMRAWAGQAKERGGDAQDPDVSPRLGERVREGTQERLYMRGARKRVPAIAPPRSLLGSGKPWPRPRGSVPLGGGATPLRREEGGKEAG